VLSSREFVQSHAVSGDKCFLLGGRPTLELGLAAPGSQPAWKRFGVDKRDGKPFRGERGAPALTVAAQARFEVVGRADVEGTVRTAKDVHAVHDDDDGIVGEGRARPWRSARRAP
jgi:hypothetical protein